MKESKYNIIKPLESGEYLVFNTFNGGLSIFKNKEDYKNLSSNITWYKDGDTYITAYPQNVKKYK